MLFHTLPFMALFLPFTLLFYYFATRTEFQRCFFLSVMSLVFYAVWNVYFLPLLIGSILLNWVAVAAHEKYKIKIIIPAAIVLDISALVLFKYAAFFAGAVTDATGMTFVVWNVILPLGISFFTFHQISYLLDVRRGEASLCKLSDYFLYVTFFPQLVAGPIVRLHEVVPQYALNPRRPGVAERLGKGSMLFLIGMMKKVLLADPLGAIADPLYRHAVQGVLPFTDGWMAVFSFGLQIYYDFSGYTDMALGLALMFGLILPENFNVPYRSLSIQDFWRRWHMSLSRFFRDYLYIPLGGSRNGNVRYVAAILVTMLLCGLWHGGAWGFVIWGGAHGLGLIVCHFWKQQPLRLPVFLAWTVTFFFVFLAWVLFRADSTQSFVHVFSGLWHLWEFIAPARPDLLIIIAAFSIAVAGPTARDFVEKYFPPNLILGLVAGMALTGLLLYEGGVSYRQFVYFIF